MPNPLDKSAACPAAQIRTLRENHGLSLRDLARKAGVNASTISRIEAGRSSSEPGTLLRIANALGVPAAALKATPTGADVLTPAEQRLIGMFRTLTPVQQAHLMGMAHGMSLAMAGK